MACAPPERLVDVRTCCISDASVGFAAGGASAQLEFCPWRPGRCGSHMPQQLAPALCHVRIARVSTRRLLYREGVRVCHVPDVRLALTGSYNSTVATLSQSASKQSTNEAPPPPPPPPTLPASSFWATRK